MHLNQNQCGSEKEKRRRLSRTLTSHIMQASYRLTWPICTTLSLPLKMAELSIITLKIHLPSTTGLLQIRSVMSINSKHRGNREIIAYVSIERKCQVVLSVLNAVHRTDFICSSRCPCGNIWNNERPCRTQSFVLLLDFSLRCAQTETREYCIDLAGRSPSFYCCISVTAALRLKPGEE